MVGPYEGPAAAESVGCAMSTAETVRYRHRRGDIFQSVLVTALSRRSATVVDCDLDGQLLPGAAARQVRPQDIYTAYAAEREPQARVLLQPSLNLNRANPVRPDDLRAATAVFDAMMGRAGAATRVSLVDHHATVFGVLAGTARHVATITGWSDDPLAWHPAARRVPAVLAPNPVPIPHLLSAGPPPELDDDVVVLPDAVFVAVARSVLSSRSGLLIEARLLNDPRLSREGLARWQRWVAVSPPPVSSAPVALAQTTPAAAIRAALAQLQDSGLATVPAIRAAQIALERALALLGEVAPTTADLAGTTEAHP